MANVIKTSLGRILDLPVSIKDISSGELIVSTNAPGGRLFVDFDSQGDEQLNDASLLQDESGNYRFISLPLIADLQLEEEKKNWNLAAKLKQISQIEMEEYESGN